MDEVFLWLNVNCFSIWCASKSQTNNLQVSLEKHVVFEFKSQAVWNFVIDKLINLSPMKPVCLVFQADKAGQTKHKHKELQN